MCDKCSELDKKIERYRRVIGAINDRLAVDGITQLIKEAEAEKANFIRRASKAASVGGLFQFEGCFFSPLGPRGITQLLLCRSVFVFGGQFVEIWLVPGLLVFRLSYRDRNAGVFNLDRSIRRYK